MRQRLRCVLWLLPLALTGCFHLPFHRTTSVKAAELAPSLPLSEPVELAVVELPPHELVIPAKPIYNLREQPQPVIPQFRHRRIRVEEVTAPQEGTTSSEVSAIIGPLSSGDPPNFRQQTMDSIASIERGLSGINRSLSDPERKTADQIREFLKQAKSALDSGDVEGAHTLAGKAQVLLAGLTH